MLLLSTISILHQSLNVNIAEAFFYTAYPRYRIPGRTTAVRDSVVTSWKSIAVSLVLLFFDSESDISSRSLLVPSTWTSPHSVLYRYHHQLVPRQTQAPSPSSPISSRLPQISLHHISTPQHPPQATPLSSVGCCRI